MLEICRWRQHFGVTRSPNLQLDLLANKLSGRSAREAHKNVSGHFDWNRVLWVDETKKKNRAFMTNTRDGFDTKRRVVKERVKNLIPTFKYSEGSETLWSFSSKNIVWCIVRGHTHDVHESHGVPGTLKQKSGCLCQEVTSGSGLELPEGQ